MLEFTFSVSILLLGVIGILDCSRLVYLDHYVGSAARMGARYAMVRGSTWSGTSCSSGTYKCAAISSDVKNYVIGTTPTGLSTTSLGVTATWPGTTAAGGSCDSSLGANSPNCTVSVTVTYPFQFMIPFVPGTSRTLSSTSVITITQ